MAIQNGLNNSSSTMYRSNTLYPPYLKKVLGLTAAPPRALWLGNDSGVCLVAADNLSEAELEELSIATDAVVVLSGDASSKELSIFTSVDETAGEARAARQVEPNGR